MGAVKCLPQKDPPAEPAKDATGGTTSAGGDGDVQQQIAELRKKYAESQAALEAQLKVCKVQEQRINEFQQLSEQSQSELNSLKQRGGESVALSAVMLKFAKEGSGKAASRRVNFLHTDNGENIVILTTVSTGAVKQYTVQGVSDDPDSASLSKLKEDEAGRMLILDCEGKKVPLLVEEQSIRDKWLNAIQHCLEQEIKE